MYIFSDIPVRQFYEEPVSLFRPVIEVVVEQPKSTAVCPPSYDEAGETKRPTGATPKRWQKVL